MKITFLGTAAAEGFPALFCNCKYCKEAREIGGKNLRTRSQSLINDDLLIDIPADTLAHFQQNGIRGDRIKYLLITHSHSDHFYPTNLSLRGSCYAHDLEEETLHVLCSREVYARCTELRARVSKDIANGLDIILAEPYETVTLGTYSITPLPARHAGAELAVIYIISDGERTMLYAHDTGYFYDEVFDYIKGKGIRFDLATFDCTNAHLPSSLEGSHMGFDSIALVIDRLRALGAIDGSSKLFVNHFSHNGNPLHSDMEASAARIGCSVSYDGRAVEF